MSDPPAWGDPQRPAGDDQPPDDAWAAPTSDPPPAGGPGPGPAPTTEPASTDRPEPASTGGWEPPSAAPTPNQDDGPPRLPPPPGEPPDANTTAIEVAGLTPESADWLRQVAAQVEPRLDRVSVDWRSSPQAGAARACAFGLLLGHLARLYPHARQDLSRAAEAHPSYSTLQPGNRLVTLEQISADPQRMAAWLGPLINVNDPQRIRALLD